MFLYIVVYKWNPAPMCSNGQGILFTSTCLHSRQDIVILYFFTINTALIRTAREKISAISVKLLVLMIFMTAFYDCGQSTGVKLLLLALMASWISCWNHFRTLSNKTSWLAKHIDHQFRQQSIITSTDWKTLNIYNIYGWSINYTGHWHKSKDNFVPNIYILLLDCCSLSGHS